MEYADEFIQHMGLGDPTLSVYHYIFDKEDSNDTKIIQYFVINGLWLCIKLDGFVSHMFYVWPLSHNTVVPVAMK